MKRAILLLAVVAGTAQTPQTQQPVFRSGLEIVTVDVSVRTGGTPVGGLRARDFVLLDNGVPQTIESIEMEEVPIDVSVLVDANEDVTMGLEHVHDDIARIAAALRPSDRLRVTTINGGVADLVRARPAAGFPRVDPLTSLRGISTAADGIGAALMRAGGTDRRQLIIAITNGVDATSSLAMAALPALARESHAVLHVVLLDVELLVPVSVPPRYTTGRQRLDAARLGLTGLRPPTRLFWRPYDSTQDINVLRDAAESTGGDVHLPGLLRGDARRVFERVFRDYRRSYLLRYTPTGVKREGWHGITVTTPAYPSYEIRARRGYSIDGPPPAAPRPEPSVASLGASTLDTAVAAYERANYDGLRQLLARARNPVTLVADFRARPNPWPANPRLEAAFALELADAALRPGRADGAQAAQALLEAQRRLVRHPIEPDAFERYWLWGTVALLQGSNAHLVAREFADYAHRRFPEEPRFALARAVLLDRTRAFDATDGRSGAAHRDHVRDLTAAYDRALAFAEVAAEAQVRKAVFLHRIGRHDEALALLDGVRPQDLEKDEVMAYLHALFRGRVLEALERHDEAAVAYEAALARSGHAQSPRVALMRLAVRAGDRARAAQLAEAIQTGSAASFDPWWAYWLGDYRLYGAIIERLREMAR